MVTCPRCHAEYQDWATVCSDCRIPLVAGSDSADAEEEPQQDMIRIQFTLRSGEKVDVADYVQEGATPEAIQRYGQELAADLSQPSIGAKKVRTFTYWDEDQFYMDAVLMEEVAAFSIYADEGEEEEEGEEQ